MSDTFQKVSPGQPLEIGARTWNGLLEAGRKFAQAKLGKSEQLPLESNPLVGAVRVLVSNDTGGDLDEFSVVAISAPPILPTDDPFGVQARPLLSGTTPAATTDAIAILQQPLAEDAIGRATVQGIAVCTVDITDLGHTWANPTASDATKMTSGESGIARILWFASQETTPATGDQLGLVLLGNVNNGLLTGNTAIEASGSTATIPTIKLEAVKPLRVRGPADARTIAMIPPTEADSGYDTLDVVTNVCPIKKWLSITLSGATLETLTATPVLNDTEVADSVEVVTGIRVEKTPLAIIPESAGAEICEIDPANCCPPIEFVCGECTATLPSYLVMTLANRTGVLAGLPNSVILYYSDYGGHPRYTNSINLDSPIDYAPWIPVFDVMCDELLFNFTLVNAWICGTFPDCPYVNTLTPGTGWAETLPGGPPNCNSFNGITKSWSCPDDILTRVGCVFEEFMANYAVECTATSQTGSMDIYLSAYQCP